MFRDHFYNVISVTTTRYPRNRYRIYLMYNRYIHEPSIKSSAFHRNSRRIIYITGYAALSAVVRLWIRLKRNSSHTNMYHCYNMNWVRPKYTHNGRGFVKNGFIVKTYKRNTTSGFKMVVSIKPCVDVYDRNVFRQTSYVGNYFLNSIFIYYYLSKTIELFNIFRLDVRIYQDPSDYNVARIIGVYLWQLWSI